MVWTKRPLKVPSKPKLLHDSTMTPRVFWHTNFKENLQAMPWLHQQWGSAVLPAYYLELSLPGSGHPGLPRCFSFLNTSHCNNQKQQHNSAVLLGITITMTHWPWSVNCSVTDINRLYDPDIYKFTLHLSWTTLFPLLSALPRTEHGASFFLHHDTFLISPNLLLCHGLTHQGGYIIQPMV